MGKKSRKQKEKKENRERLNQNGVTIDSIKFGTQGPMPKGTKNDCMHDGMTTYILVGRKDWQKRRYLEQGSAIAAFGQRYAYQSTLLPNLTDISVIWIHLQEQSGLIDEQFVKIAHASPVSEIIDGGIDRESDYELARFKCELGIVSKCWLDVGKQEFSRVLPNPLSDGMRPMSKPDWLLEMEEKLDAIRCRDSALVLYLASHIPCNCLDKHGYVEKAKKEDKEAIANETNDTKDEHKCDHVPTDSSRIVEECGAVMQEKVLKFSIFKSMQEDATYRDFKSLMKFFNDNHDYMFYHYMSYHANDFATFAFSYATTIIVDQRKYEWSERIANLGLLAEVFAEHGFDEVTEALQCMEDPKPRMKPYLRELYIEMRKTNTVSSFLRLLQKKISCNCVDELRGIMHAEGSDRNEVCDVCYRPCPKHKFLKWLVPYLCRNFNCRTQFSD